MLDSGAIHDSHGVWPGRTMNDARHVLVDAIDSGDLDEYRLIRSLGKGAMGQVYLGHDTVLDRPVAIKLLNAADPSAAARLRFLVEARAIARLSHPNVVTVFRVGEHNGTPYLVSEYIRGTSLDRLDRPVPWERVLAIAIDLAHGLAAAHRRGVMHRDIKPANAILSENGTVKLLDFGLAKLAQRPVHEDYERPSAETAAPRTTAADAAADADADSRDGTTAPVAGDAALAETADGPPASATETRDTTPLTETRDTAPLEETADGTLDLGPGRAAQRDPITTTPATLSHGDSGHAGRLTSTGTLLGTPLYMAPEIWRGEEASMRSDLYSLGALLYELACAHPPHPASELAALERAACHSDAPRLDAQRTDFEPRWAPLCELVDQCLHRDPQTRPSSADEVVQRLDSLAAGVRDPALTTENPYRGLHPFAAEHRAFFFGRSMDVRAIIDTLRAESMVVVAGDSGVGKSSVCRAGVVPAVEAGKLGGGRIYRSHIMVPGRRPMDTLLDLLAPMSDTPARALLDEFRDQPGELERRMSRALGPKNGLLLLIDQFEELVTQSEREQAGWFAEALARLASARTGVMSGIRILVTARGDFLTRLSGLPGLSGPLNRGVYVLRPLSSDDLRQVIVGPARAAGVAFESQDMIDELVDQADHHDSGLPLLQFALHELWQARDRDRAIIPRAALDRVGGVVGALTRHADQVLAGFRPRERQAARTLLTAMVDAQGMSTRRRRSELLPPDDPDPGPDHPADEPGEHRRDHSSNRALTALIKSRLVIARESEDGESTYELAHEALVRSWATLREWLHDDRDQRALRQRLTVAAAEWQRLHQRKDALWRRAQLSEVARTGIAASDLAGDAARFLGASQAHERRQRRLRWLAIIAAPALIAAIYSVFAGRAWLEQERTLDAYTQRAEIAQRQADESYRAFRELHDRALTFFDRGEDVEGVNAWAEVRRQADEVINAYQAAVTELSAANQVAGRPAIRRSLVTVLHQQMEVADSVFLYERRDALRDRLLTYDDGTMAARWRAPASLTVDSNPSGAFTDVARYRPEGGHLVLEPPILHRATPLTADDLPAGSYLVTIAAPGRAPVRYPVQLRPGESHRVTLDLPPSDSVPEGMIYIPPGRFSYGSDIFDNKNFLDLQAAPLHDMTTPAYLIARTEVTMADWMQYLRALPPDERSKRSPDAAGISLVELPDRTFELRIAPSGVHEYRVKEGQEMRYHDRTSNRQQDWSRFPVVGVSWDDARAYSAWLAATGRVPGARLCTDHEWERAARGGDSRRYPHGNKMDPGDANHDTTHGRKPRAFGPDEVASHPRSDSPFGVADMAGNAWEWVHSVYQSENGVTYRGGSYYQEARDSFVFNRRPAAFASMRNRRTGIRVCATWNPDRRSEIPGHEPPRDASPEPTRERVDP